MLLYSCTRLPLTYYPRFVRHVLTPATHPFRVSSCRLALLVRRAALSFLHTLAPSSTRSHLLTLALCALPRCPLSATDGDYAPTGPRTKVFVMFYIVLGVVVTTLTTTLCAQQDMVWEYDVYLEDMQEQEDMVRSP